MSNAEGVATDLQGNVVVTGMSYTEIGSLLSTTPTGRITSGEKHMMAEVTTMLKA